MDFTPTEEQTEIRDLAVRLLATGTAVEVGAVVMGVDLLAVDSTGCRLMGIPPERLPVLRLAEQKRLGNLREELIPQIGEEIAALAKRFELPPGIDKQLVPAGK